MHMVAISNQASASKVWTEVGDDGCMKPSRYRQRIVDLLFPEVCCDATPMHPSTVQGKTASPLFSVALQIRLTACLCNHTYGDLLFIQLCNNATPMHCSNGQSKTACPVLSAALQRRLAAGTVSMQLHIRRFALRTGLH